jgi:tetratricopeptide (TPR) repeat protein
VTQGPKRPPIAPPPQRKRLSDGPTTTSAASGSGTPPPYISAPGRKLNLEPLAQPGQRAAPPPRTARPVTAAHAANAAPRSGSRPPPPTLKMSGVPRELLDAPIVLERQSKRLEFQFSATAAPQIATSQPAPEPPRPPGSGGKLPPSYPFAQGTPAAIPSLTEFAEPWLRTGQFDALSAEDLARADANLGAAEGSVNGRAPRQVAPSIVVDFEDDGRTSHGRQPAAAVVVSRPPPPMVRPIRRTPASQPPAPAPLGQAREVTASADFDAANTTEVATLLTGHSAPTAKGTSQRRIPRSHDPALMADAAILLADADLGHTSEVFVGPGAVDAPPNHGGDAPRTSGFIADPERQRLWAALDFQALIQYLIRAIAVVVDPDELSALHTDLGRAYDEDLAPDRAMFEFGKALEHDPHHHAAQSGMEAAARKISSGALAKWNEIATNLRRCAERSADEFRLAGWYEILHRIYMHELKQREVANTYYDKLVRLAPTHRLVLERLANEARAQGDPKRQAVYLARAVGVTNRSEDRARLLLALGEVHEGPLAAPEAAMSFLEQARAESEATPLQHCEALRAMERLGRQSGEPLRVVTALRELLQFELPLREQIELRVRLAEVLEKDLCENGSAVIELQAALELEPSNRKALGAIERCQIALGAWPAVAQATRAKADASSGTRQRIELYFSAAEIFEHKANDPGAAFQALRQITLIDDRNRRALTELRRLGEVLASWDDATAFGVRLAELTTDKREASRQHAALGAMLVGPGNDALGAQLQFERAAELDPKNMPALAALEQLARGRGDAAALSYLEQRAQAADRKTERANLYVQLARDYVAIGDGARALGAYEHAYHADNSALEAAAALLENYLACGRFEDAAPLCEQLIASAPTSEPQEHRLRRLRLATRIRASLGAEEPALSAARRAFRCVPYDAGVREDLIEVAHRISSAHLTPAREDLEAIAHQAHLLPVGHALKLASALAASGATGRALNVLESLYKANPALAEPLIAMEALLLAARSWQRAAECKALLAERLQDEDRFRKLCEAGDLWTRELGDIKSAARAFEEARALRPHDPWILDTLCWAYEELHEYRRLAEILRAQCDSEPATEKKVTRLSELAQLELHKLQNPRGAMALYEEVLELAPGRHEAFRALAAAGTEAQEYRMLERYYRKMLGRLQPGLDDVFLAQLWSGLAAIYDGPLQDPLSAIEALKAYIHLDGSNLSIFERAIELCYGVNRLDTAIDFCRTRATQDPFDPRAYDLLFDAAFRTERYDVAWCALDVLRQLADLQPEQATYYANYQPYEAHEIAGALTEDAWRGYLLHPAMDQLLTELLACAAPAAGRVHANAVKAATQLAPEHTAYAEALYDLVAQTSAVFGVSPPPLYVHQGPEAIVHLANPSAGIGVYPRAVESDPNTVPFQLVKAVAEQRPELFAAGCFPTPHRLSELVAQTVAPHAPLKKWLSEAAASKLTQLVDEATRTQTKYNVRHWSLLAHVSSARAAVLTRGTVHEAAAFYASTSDDPQAVDKLGLIYSFVVSEEYGALRRAIGNAVGS